MRDRVALLNARLNAGIDSSDDMNACQVWTRAIDADGYGKIGEPGTRRILRTHVVAFELHYGKPAKGLVLHTCDNRSCCNWRHLYDGTHEQNSRDMVDRDRHGFGGRSRIASVGRRQLVFALSGLGFSQVRISRATHLSRTTIRKILSEGAQYGHTQARGERVHTATVTDKDVIEIRRQYANGVSRSCLASRFGMSKTALRSVVLGETWKHLLADPRAQCEEVRDRLGATTNTTPEEGTDEH